MLLLVLVSLASSMPVTPGVAETARLAWNSWQEYERDNLPWLYRCDGIIGLFCPGPGPDVYDLIPDLPMFPGMIPPPEQRELPEQPEESEQSEEPQELEQPEQPV